MYSEIGERWFCNCEYKFAFTLVKFWQLFNNSIINKCKNTKKYPTCGLSRYFLFQVSQIPQTYSPTIPLVVSNLPKKAARVGMSIMVLDSGV